MSTKLPQSSQLAQLLFHAGFNSTDESDDAISKDEALRWTAGEGLTQLTQQLIDKGADVNARGGYFNATPLHHAAKNGSLDILRMLLAAGADISIRDKDSETPLKYAARDDRCDAARLLIENGADIETRDYMGRTPLLEAANGGKVAVVKVLWELKANIHCADDLGFTPLHHAGDRGHLEMVQLLLDLGADVTRKCDKGYTTLSMTLRFPDIL